MISVRLSGNSNIDAFENKVKALLRDASRETLRTARSLTPVRTGFAKSKWAERITKSGYTVSNPVDYVQYLDKGSSRQAPQGITKPTARKVAGYINTRRLKR